MRADADGGLIFYIIIAIIGIVSSIIQKKGKQINQPHGGKEILTDFPELPYENDADTVQEEIKPLVNKPNTITPNNQYNEYLEKTIIQNNFYSKDIINEGLPAFSYEDEIKKTEIKNFEEQKIQNTIDFDIKKAIIFSEILNRKY